MGPLRKLWWWLWNTRKGQVVLLAAVGMGLVLLLVVPRLTSNSPSSVPLSTFVGQINAHQVADANLDSKAQVATVTLKDNQHELVSYTSQYEGRLIDQLQAAGVKYKVTKPAQQGGTSTSWTDTLVFLIPMILVLGLTILWQRRQQRSGEFQALIESEIPAVKFEDVIGAEEILDECRQIVRCLRRPRWFRLLGVRPLTGMLISGDPGTGKTLLARAIAGEAGVPFFAVNGSDFDEQFTGVGARRVRELFAGARKHRVAIIFIDEIDSVGGKRGSNTDSGTTSYNQTVNALLAEMDGFSARRTGPMIIVIGATNGPERIDPALVRPGRLTRQLNMPTPDRIARVKILRLYAKRLPNIADDPTLFEELGRLTSGMSGADLSELVNQAGLTAEREYDLKLRAAAAAGGEPYNDSDSEEPPSYQITKDHFMSALESAQLGPERKSIEVALHDRLVTATHEAGHAVAGQYAQRPMPPRKVSIIGRGPAGGVTWATSSDKELLSRAELYSRLVYLLGARAAERLLLGENDYTFGAHNDLEKATKLARAMVCEYAMDDRYPGQLPLYDGDPRHAAIHELLRGALEKATHIVTQHRTELEAVRDALLEHETLGEEDLAVLLPA